MDGFLWSDLACEQDFRDALLRASLDRASLKSFRPGYLAPDFRMRNIVFEAHLFWFTACKTRNITFKAPLFNFFGLIEPGILYLKQAK